MVPLLASAQGACGSLITPRRCLRVCLPWTLPQSHPTRLKEKTAKRKRGRKGENEEDKLGRGMGPRKRERGAVAAVAVLLRSCAGRVFRATHPPSPPNRPLKTPCWCSVRAEHLHHDGGPLKIASRSPPTPASPNPSPVPERQLATPR